MKVIKIGSTCWVAGVSGCGWGGVGGSGSNVESTLLYSTRLDLIASKKLTGPLPIEKEDDVTFIPTSSAKWRRDISKHHTMWI